MYYYVSDEKVKAVKLFGEDKTNPNSLQWYAWCFEFGQGVEQDVEKALFLYNQNKQYPQSICRVGEQIQKSSPEQALKIFQDNWYKKHCLHSLIQLAKCYKEGLGVKRSKTEYYRLMNIYTSYTDDEWDYEIEK
jgi:TPR repeat protein